MHGLYRLLRAHIVLIMMPIRSITIFARTPVLGQVKTRLAATLGDVAALNIYRETAETAFRAALGTSNAQVTVAFTPDDGLPAMQAWVANDVSYHPQGDGDLGERLSRAVRAAVQNGSRRIVVIGTDCPAISAEIIEQALELLGRADVVIGPARDGGYYLIALRAEQPALFAGIPWSSSDTLTATLEAARRANLRVKLLDELVDIDTADDWREWCACR